MLGKPSIWIERNWIAGHQFYLAAATASFSTSNRTSPNMELLMAHRFYNHKKLMDISLLALTFVGWLFFPVMIKPIFPALMIGLFLFVVAVTCLIAVKIGPPKIEVNKFTKTLLLLFSGYMGALIFASVLNGEIASIKQAVIQLSKFFFVFLIAYSSKKFISVSMNIYSNLFVFVCGCSIASFIYIEYGFPPLFEFKLNGVPTNVNWVSFQYSYATPLFNLAGRLQGLSEEPGSFSFSILPAFFWVLFSKKNYFVILIFIVALMLSMSIGVSLFLLTIYFMLSIKRKNFFIKENLWVFTAGVSIVFIYIFIRYYGDSITSGRELTTTFSGKLASSAYRIEGVKLTIDYLLTHPFGAGSSYIIKELNHSIAVGYMIVAGDAGIVGGVVYFMSFGLVGYTALKMFIYNDYKDVNSMVLSISILAVLFMGLQRMQPDGSYWHMWLLSMFIVHQNRISGTIHC